MNQDYIEINKKSWDQQTKINFNSKFYDVKSFLDGKSSLNSIELSLLPDIKKSSLLHLQCHFGMDSISLARLGANVTAVDFSPAAIEKANEINIATGNKVSFICSDIYEISLKEKFDLVFSSYGTIGWLPDLNKWANIISTHLKTGGKFIFAEFHPIVWMFDSKFQKIEYNYSIDKKIIEIKTGTYAEKDADISLKTITWNHSLSEVITCLIDSGLEILHFKEYDYSPYNCFTGTEEYEKGKFRISHLGNKIPMVYSIEAVKK